MQRIEQESCYVLHSRAFGESSLILELLSRNYGRIGALARGARQSSKGNERIQLGACYRVDLVGSGELLQWRKAEMMRATPHLQGQRALAMLYIHELLIALLARSDPHPQLYHYYEQLLGELSNAELAPLLRRFERRLLDDLGYGIDFESDAQGMAIAPERVYRLDPETGFLPSQLGATGAISGTTICALATGNFAPTDHRPALVLMRSIISAHLGGRSLHSWELIRDLSKPSLSQS